MVVSLQDTKIIFTKSFAIGNTGFKAFQMHLLIAFLVVNKNNYCCLPMCRFHYRLTMWILNLKPTCVPFSSGKYNCSYRHLSRLQMLHTAANSTQTLTFPKLWPAILLAAEVFKSMAGRLFLAKMPWNRKGITKLTWDLMGKEINGQIRKSKQDTHHQNFLCLVGVYKAGPTPVMTGEWYHDLFGYNYRQHHFVKSWQLPNSWLPQSSVKYNPTARAINKIYSI